MVSVRLIQEGGRKIIKPKMKIQSHSGYNSDTKNKVDSSAIGYIQ